MGGMLGQETPRRSHLVKAPCEAALDRRPGLSVFGDDYPTPDGTYVRDYIHVDDVAAAHMGAPEYLLSGDESAVLNCGCGRGHSVRDVIDYIKFVSDPAFPVVTRHRRRGDPSALVADTYRMLQLLG